MFKINNNKGTRKKSLTSVKFHTNFTPSSNVSILYFEGVNICYITPISTKKVFIVMADPSIRKALNIELTIVHDYLKFHY